MAIPPLAHLFILLAGAVLTLLAALALPRRWQTLCAGLALLTLVLAAAAAAALLPQPPAPGPAATLVLDRPGVWATVLLLGAAGLSLLLAVGPLRGDPREGEFYALLLLATLGGALLTGAADLAQIMLALLLLAAGSYPLVAFPRSGKLATEAATKYFLLSAMGHLALLYGLVLLYGLTGSTVLADMGRLLDPGNRLAMALGGVLVVTGLGLKAGHLPAPFWMPDAYQAAPPFTAAFIATVPPVAAFLALARLSAGLRAADPDWGLWLAGLAAATLCFGTLAALVQTDLRRLLGYVSITHSGYWLLGLAALPAPLAQPALHYLLLTLVLANIGAFAALAALGAGNLSELRGKAQAQPLASLGLGLALLSLTGLPPLAGGLARFLLFTAAADAGLAWLAAVGAVSTALSLYWALRVIASLFQGKPALTGSPSPLPGALSMACGLASLAAGVGAGAFLGSIAAA